MKKERDAKRFVFSHFCVLSEAFFFLSFFSFRFLPGWHLSWGGAFKGEITTRGSIWHTGKGGSGWKERNTC